MLQAQHKVTPFEFGVSVESWFHCGIESTLGIFGMTLVDVTNTLQKGGECMEALILSLSSFFIVLLAIPWFVFLITPVALVVSFVPSLFVLFFFLVREQKMENEKIEKKEIPIEFLREELKKDTDPPAIELGA